MLYDWCKGDLDRRVWRGEDWIFEFEMGGRILGG